MASPQAEYEFRSVRSLAQRNGWRPEPIGESVERIPILSWWPGDVTPTRVVFAAVHGEEAPTLQLMHTLLRSIDASDACAVVVPVLNPDGVLHGTRSNAHGVDLNRNFPCSTWKPDLSPTYWPTTQTRRTEFRTQMSSPGSAPASEPETQAIIGLIERIAPDYVVDVHAPLDCVIAINEASHKIAEALAEPAGLKIVKELKNPTPGDSAQWAVEQGIPAVTYEIEMGPLPQLWARHREGLARAIVAKPLHR